MNALDQLRDVLRGRKTYLVAIAAIATALAAFAGGTITDTELVRTIYEAVAACTIRAGIATATKGDAP